MVVRYADDFVMGFESKADAREMLLARRVILKHKTEGKRLTRKLTALRRDAWRLMHAPLAIQHERFTAVLRGHYGYYGGPHNYLALKGLLGSGSDLAALS